MPTCCTDMDFERFMWCDASKMILTPRHPVARQPRDSLLWKSWFYQHTYLNYAIPSDRKSTRLNSSHANISYAVFCLKKKNALYPWGLSQRMLLVDHPWPTNTTHA